MRKIPTIFRRDPENPSLVTDQPHPDCEWVFRGEGIPTRKWDGTACYIAPNGRLMKRKTLEIDDPIPSDAIIVEVGPSGRSFVGPEGHSFKKTRRICWLPVGDGPEDKWHREGYYNLINRTEGTYELCGPKINGNPERFRYHVLIPHVSPQSIRFHVPTSFDELREWLTGRDIEGVVWQHPDGRMAKIKLRDFGLKRGDGI